MPTQERPKVYSKIHCSERKHSGGRLRKSGYGSSYCRELEHRRICSSYQAALAETLKPVAPKAAIGSLELGIGSGTKTSLLYVRGLEKRSDPDLGLLATGNISRDRRGGSYL